MANRAGAASELLRPYPAELMAAYPGSTIVNNAKNEDAQCIEPIDLESAGDG